MANNCTTKVEFFSSEKALNWLESEVERIKGSENITDAFGNSFRMESDTQPDGTISGILDIVGSKWIRLNDWYKDDDRYTISFESAWYPPKDLIERMVEKLSQLSEGEDYVNPNDEDYSYAKGTYYDETFSPCGAFASYGIGNTDESEDEPEITWEEFEQENPDGSYWDEVIQPLLERLEEEV